MEGRKGDTKRGTMTKTQGRGITGGVCAEGGERLEGPRSKIVYNEEAAGRPGTGSSHYRRSSSATRLSILVARHANVERPARCTCSCTTVHQLRPLRTRARSPPFSAPRLPLLSSSSPFLFEPASRLFRSFGSIRSFLLALFSPSNLVFSFLLGQANVFRVFFFFFCYFFC